MNIQFLKTPKEYKKQYVSINNQVYTLKEALSVFSEQEKQILTAEKSQKHKKYKIKYKYPSKKSMLKQIEHQKELLFEKLNIEKATSAYQNKTIANKLLVYLCKNTTLDMSVTEDRLLSLKEHTHKFEQSNKNLEQALKNKVYKNDKKYKKTKKLLKQLQNQVSLQKTKMLFNTLVRKRSANQDDAYTLLYLLSSLNIKTYKLTLINKTENKNYALVMVAIKQKTADPLRYYAYDITLNKKIISINETDKKTQNNLKILGKDELQSFCENYELSSLETLENAYSNQDEEFKKVFGRMSKQSIEIN